MSGRRFPLPLVIAALLLAGCATPASPGDQSPVPRVQVPAQYPYELARAGLTGHATVEFIIDTKGDVTQAWVVEATHPAFGPAAVNCVLKWKFLPGRKGGRPVNVRVSQRLEFDLASTPLPAGK